MFILLFFKQCGKPFTSEDAVPINGTEEEMKKLGEKMVERRQLAKASKVMHIIIVFVLHSIHPNRTHTIHLRLGALSILVNILSTIKCLFLAFAMDSTLEYTS